MVKLNGKVISEKVAFKVEVCDGWCNSMDTYYPYINVFAMVDGKPTVVDMIPGGDCTNPRSLELALEMTPDATMLAEYQAYQIKKEEEHIALINQQERETVRKGRDVLVFKGRKVPKGTVGRVFWIGDNGWGTSVGIEQTNGQKVFTAITNVRVLGESA
jgi:hypothetical protein